MTLLLLFGLLAVLIVLQMPVAFAMGLSAIVTITLTQPIPLSIVVQRMGTGLDSFVLIAIPLFVLAGHLLNRAGIADRIFAFAAALAGHIRGGLAHVNVVASMIFAGMSGVAQADAAGLGVVEVNAMRKEGFDPAVAAAISAASSIIGPIIPPSVIMVVYAVMVQVSVADMFLAGFLPGILMGGALMITIYWMVRTGRMVAPPTVPMSYPRLGPHFRARAARLGRAGTADRRAAGRRGHAHRAGCADSGLCRGPGLRAARAEPARRVRGAARNADHLRRAGLHHRLCGALRLDRRHFAGADEAGCVHDVDLGEQVSSSWPSSTSRCW